MSAGADMRVGFMVIGAQKCGTTSLAYLLEQHPEVCFCKVKEPNYFSSVEDWRPGLDAYHRLYENVGGRLCGEASPQYTFLPEYHGTHRRVYEYNPDVRLVYLVRHPVDRIESHYAHRLLARTAEQDPDAEVLARPDYLNRSRYAVQIRPYYELFPAEHIRVVLLEDLVAAPEETLAGIAGFLGISAEPLHRADATPQNVSVERSAVRSTWLRPLYKRMRGLVLDKELRAAMRRVGGWAYYGRPLPERPRLSARVREDLWRLLEDDVRALEDLTGRDLSVWRAREGALGDGASSSSVAPGPSSGPPSSGPPSSGPPSSGPPSSGPPSSGETLPRRSTSAVVTDRTER